MDGVAGAAGSDEAAGAAGSGATVGLGGQAGKSATGGAGSVAGASTGGAAGSEPTDPSCTTDGYDSTDLSHVSAHFNPANGHCYLAVDWAANYDESYTGCSRWGGKLATITTAEEQAFIGSISVGDQQSGWIGLFAPGPSQAFVWTTYEPVAYTNWLPGQPDWGTASGSYCAVVLSSTESTPGKWADLSCTLTAGSYCEREQ